MRSGSVKKVSPAGNSRFEIKAGVITDVTAKALSFRNYNWNSSLAQM
jgi:hypothetical protein